jgi:hypothetical protein
MTSIIYLLSRFPCYINIFLHFLVYYYCIPSLLRNVFAFSVVLDSHMILLSHLGPPLDEIGVHATSLSLSLALAFLPFCP